MIPGLAGFTDVVVLREHGDTLVVRARAVDGASVIVKTHASDLPTASARERFRREHALTAAARHAHLSSASALLDQPNRAAVVLDDPGDLTLAAAVADRRIDVDGVLAAALDVAGAVAALHAAGVAHRAVDAEHIVLTPTAAVLIDLYDAWHVGARPRRATHGLHPAPEQQATTPQPVHAASDQYGLAATVRTAVEQLGAELTPGLRAVLDRAGHADPRQRYRSVLGLAADLRRVRDGTAGDRFVPTPGGIALAWEEPRQVVGRDDALHRLETLADAVAADHLGRVAVVRGPAGSGRSTLLAALCDRLADRGVVCGLGRFRTEGAVVPMAAPAESMEHIVAQLLSRPDDTADLVRAELVERLGADVGIAVQLAPAVAHLVGDPPPAPAGPLEETVARFERATRITVGTIAERVPPLVSVLDDADRVDKPTRRGWELLCGNPEVGPLLTVLSCGADPNPLDTTVERLRANGVVVDVIDLDPLDQAEVRALVAAGTGADVDDIAPFADAVWLRSGGNPGLVLADVWERVASGDLWVDVDAVRWRWSAAALAENEPTTLDEVTVARVERLDDDVRGAVVAVAAAGAAASIPMLAAWFGVDGAAAETLVDRGVAEHVLVRRGDDGVACTDGGVRRAALARLDDEGQADVELGVARALLATAPVDEHGEPALDDGVRFEVVRLLAGKRAVLDEPVERDRFVRLCEQAARAARRTAGFVEALDLQRAAMDALGEDGWRADHARAFELHLRAAEHALMLGQLDLVDRLLATMAAHEPTALERVRTMRVLGTRAWIGEDSRSGLEALREILRELGEAVPARPTWADIGREYVATRRALGSMQPEHFLTAPRLDDERRRAALDAMLGCVHLAYIDQPLTHVLLVLRGTRLTAQHGVTDSSAYFLTAYGMLLLSVPPTAIARGLRFGRVGMALAERAGGMPHTMVTFAYNAFVRHWGEPLATTIEPMTARYDEALANRQRGYGLTCGSFALLHSLLANRPLRGVELEASERSEAYEGLGERALGQRVAVVAQAVADLRTWPRDGYLDGELFSTSSWLARKPRGGEAAATVHALRAFVAQCFDDRVAMAEAVAASAPAVRTAPGQVAVTLHAFHVAYLDADACGRASASGRPTAAARRVTAERSLRRLRKLAEHDPADHAHRVALVEAVLAEARSDTRGGAAAAMERFDAAVSLATANGALHDLGVVAERAARFHVGRGSSALAAHYAAIAADAWRSWGANAVAATMADRLPAALVQRVTSPSGEARPAPAGGLAAPATADAFAEASRLLGQELEVREFLERLLEILLRHADATRGFLILETPSGPVVEVAAHRTGAVVDVLPMPSPSLADHDELCMPAVSYVLRTRHELSLVDPANDRRFRADPELRARAPRALLCLPIGRAAGTSGALLLESDMYSHAFEPDRIEALRVLSAQAISTIDHARVRSDLSTLADDLARLRQTADELTAKAETDSLTGVANRVGLESRLHAAIRSAQVHAGHDDGDGSPQVGVLFCDLDGFKAVNDRHGHSAGDRMLAEIADRLRHVVRADDIVARVGGDEFVVVSVGVANEELARIAERARSEIARPVELDGETTAAVSVSIGVGRADLGRITSVDDVDALVQLADEAMYRAKQAGKNQVHLG